MNQLSAISIASAEQSLCLLCGLCCNGVIFGDVQLQPGENAARLRSLGLKLKGDSSCQPRLIQPCAAYDGCRCRIYAERPKYCLEFECLLLKSVKDGRLEPAAALKIIGRAREQADSVRHLLRELGDTDETLALAARFRRTVRRLERSEWDARTAALHAQLTLEVHELNRLLSKEVYPGEAA